MKLSKVLSIVSLIVVLLFVATNFVYAIDPASISGTTVSGTSKITSLGNKIVTLIQTVGSVVAVVILFVFGIKYMMGSTEEKAEYKKTLLPYIIGAVLIFAAVNIAGFVFDWANSI